MTKKAEMSGVLTKHADNTPTRRIPPNQTDTPNRGTLEACQQTTIPMTDGDPEQKSRPTPAKPEPPLTEAATAKVAHETLAEDPGLGPIASEHGVVELAPADDPFQRLVVSILRQQVSMSAAAAIQERLFAEVDVTPQGVLAAEETILREAGLSAAKTEYVRELATAWSDRGYSRTHFDDLSDGDIAAELTEIRGVGPWTVDMFLMFGLGRPDVFPVGDLGIRKGMWELFGDDLTRGEMKTYAERWQPYRSYASLYLWRAYDG